MEKNVRKNIEIDLLSLAHTIVADYGGVLADTLDESLGKNPRLGLHPESVLPYSKGIIRIAFLILLENLEKTGEEEIWGMSKDNLKSAAMTLDRHFSPDEQVPDDPHLNARA